MTARLLWLAAAALTVLGACRDPGRVPAFLGGLCWAAGTVCALAAEAGLEQVLAVTLALLLASTGFWRRAEG